MFAVFGPGLGPATLAQAQSFPLTRVLAGASATVTVLGVSVDTCPLYVSDGQIGVMMPSSAPLGTGTLTVTFQGESSAPESITVVRRNFGAFTVNQAGSGPAIVQNFVSETSQHLNTLVTPAKPGQTVIHLQPDPLQG